MADRQRDVIEVLTHDHREVERMFEELESLRGAMGEDASARRKDLVEQATIELIKHSVAEEAEVYPAVRAKVSKAEAERAKAEHAEAEEQLKRLERLRPDDPVFDAELATLMAEVRQHVVEEETDVFPHMRQVLSDDELLELGKKVEAVKKLAPTRPHPSAPDEPPGNLVLGPLVGMFDRMRDAVSGRGADG